MEHFGDTQDIIKDCKILEFTAKRGVFCQYTLLKNKKTGKVCTPLPVFYT
jgi:hypothetical protein